MNHFQKQLATKSDIQEHLGLLHGLAMDCKKVVELGFRTGVSTTAFLAAGCKVYSYDITSCEPHASAFRKSYGDRFKFFKGDSTKVEIPECDMLFIDTDHKYATMKKELELHHNKVKKWISIHDTTTFGKQDRKGGGPGLLKAIDEFRLDQDMGLKWSVLLHLRNNNGLTVLERRHA